MVNFLEEPEVMQREEEIAVAMVNAILEDMNKNFLQCRKAWAQDGRMS